MKSKPGQEAFLFEQLTLRRIESYYPTIFIKAVNSRARKTRSYFPGYLFVHLDPTGFDFIHLRWTPGAEDLVNYGGELAFVPDAMLDGIRRRVDQLNGLGTPTSIQTPVLSGHEVIFDRCHSGSERVEELLNLLREKQFEPARSISQWNSHLRSVNGETVQKPS
jgi:transcriptional antiterminator RfaH